MDRSELLRLPTEDVAARCGDRLHIVPDRKTLYEQFAREIAGEIAAGNREGRGTRLVLPVGPIDQYPLLAEICNRERISWSAVSVFFMDEYCDWQGRPLTTSHPLSFEGTARSCLISRIDEELRIPDEQLWFPTPDNLDRTADEIERDGGIDTCYGGIGIHGHVAFNEPPITDLWRVDAAAFLDSGPRLVRLNQETVTLNAARSWGGDLAGFPPFAVTLGMRQIVGAKRVRLYCPGGSWQRSALRLALLGEPSVEYPVSLLREHPDLRIVADPASAAPIDAQASFTET